MSKQPPDLREHPDAVLVRKLPIPVNVEFATEDGICETLEGDVSYMKGDALCTGVKGELWPIEKEKFMQAYLPTNTKVLSGVDGLYIKRLLDILALHLNKPMSVTVGGQKNSIKGESGDWLLQYSENDYGVIKNDIFSATYTYVIDSSERQE